MSYVSSLIDNLQKNNIDKIEDHDKKLGYNLEALRIEEHIYMVIIYSDKLDIDSQIISDYAHQLKDFLRYCHRGEQNIDV